MVKRARSFVILLIMLAAVGAVALIQEGSSAQRRKTPVVIDENTDVALTPRFVRMPKPTKNLLAGAVYVLTNQADNAVTAFSRASDGSLSFVGTFPTGGSGDPVAEAGDPPPDPLASQGALIFSEDKHLLFAVNAGSDEISVLSVGKSGLTLVDKEASGGDRPVSLTLRGNLLYVLNEEGTPNITGFTVSDAGELTPLADSTRPLSGGAAADPAQVSFSPDGTLLVVTEKDTNIIDTYTVGADGLASGPVSNPSNGVTPFGFDFNNNGHLIVSEAFAALPNAAAVSSYNISAGGALSVVSGSVPALQTATCWIVITNNGHYVYGSNTASGTISSYRLGSDGTLTLLNSVAADTGPNSAPIDMALNNGSRYLYVHAAGLQLVVGYRVESDGSLTRVGSAGGLPFGAQGIAAR